MKEIQRLCDLGVLEWQLSLEWATPSFIQPKKNKTVCFLTNFWEVNKRLVNLSLDKADQCVYMRLWHGRWETPASLAVLWLMDALSDRKAMNRS
jgi:hypothetical protein